MRDLEFKFQKELVKEMELHGWACYHPGGIPGLPDLLCFKAPHYGAMIELKVLESGDERKQIKTKFQSSQKPFYLNQIQKTETPVIIIFKSFSEDVESYSIVPLKSEYAVRNFFDSKCGDFMSGFIYDVKSLVNHLGIVIGWN